MCWYSVVKRPFRTQHMDCLRRAVSGTRVQFQCHCARHRKGMRRGARLLVVLGAEGKRANF
jgi:hypothetical protein